MFFLKYGINVEQPSVSTSNIFSTSEFIWEWTSQKRDRRRVSGGPWTCKIKSWVFPTQFGYIPKDLVTYLWLITQITLKSWDRFSFILREILSESFLRNKGLKHPYSKSYPSEDGMILKGHPTFSPAVSWRRITTVRLALGHDFFANSLTTHWP